MGNNGNDPVIVVGGGIGGLATALGLAQADKNVQVLEQAPEIGEIGAGIQLAANATNVLQRLGVMDKISEVSVFPKRLVLMDAYTGKELSALDLGEIYKERYGAPYVVLHRSDMQRILLEACEAHPNIEIRTNQQITSTKDNGNSVDVVTASGAIHSGSAVIGADGLWSTTRKQFSDDDPVCSQYVAYRGAIPMEEVTNVGNLDDVYMWIGRNMHVVQYPVRRGELYNQVVVFKSSQYRKEIERTDQWGTPEEMDEVFSNTCEKVKTAISFISRQKRWPMYDRNPIDNWTDGNITLMGDAAHPMLQYLAQGACQALEDASYLTDTVLKHGDDFKSAFLEYQQERLPRTAYVQRSARSWGEIIHTENPTATLLRNVILKQRTEKDFTFIDRYHGYNKAAMEVN
ncbi:FAD-dependent monooxygenase [Oceanobacillus saliphilus]|uniref:FAD-dependent monooxygenase n=1 Tax=Oceanobacillus saliphilus TaxID=2925834 RepID=UPI00201E062E|nr:FAD-dependent monooxygenase [Oceanobacillus saliphilus]